MSNPAPTCRNGHPVGADAAFCSVCGSPVEPAARPTSEGPGPAAAYPAPQAVYDQPYGSGGPSAPGPETAWAPSAPGYDAAWVTTAAPAQKRSRRGLVLGLVIGSVVVVAAVVLVLVLVVFRTPTTTITGDFVLTDNETAEASCDGTGGYDDISEGTTVILKNQNGKILGSGALSSGVADTSAGTCTYSFSIPDIDEGETQYAVEVSHRGQVVNSRSALKSQGWHFSLTLG